MTRAEYESRYPTRQKDLLQKTGDVVNSIFPGKQLGEAVGNSAAAIGQLARGDKQGFSDLASRSAPIKKVSGDLLGIGATLGGAALPGTGSVVKNALQLGALGAASGAGGAMSADKNSGDIFKSALISGTIGAGVSLVASGAGKLASTITKKAPAKIYNTAIKTPLQETKKAILYKGETLGEELIKRGVKGNDDKLFTYAIKQVEGNENRLQEILKKSKQTLSRAELEPYLDDLISTKQATPGLAEDVDKIRNVLKEFPEQIPIAEANQIKRNLYRALDDVAFKVDPSLSTKKEAMKAVARGIKTEIENKTAGEAGEGVVRGINKELQVFGSLKNRALDKIARANKNNLIGLGDLGRAAIGGVVGGATTGDFKGAVTGAALGLAGKTAGSTLAKTNVAVRLSQLGKVIDKLPIDNAGRISKTALITLIGKFSRQK
jgi:hypothetical protein